MSRTGTATPPPDVLRAATVQLLVTAALTYVAGLVASLVVANVARGLVDAEIGLLTPPRGTTPTWVGVLAYLQGAAGLAVVALLAAAALLGSAVEVTRSARRGERVRAWVPFRRALPRVPAVALGLAVVLPLASLALLLSVVLLVLAVVVLPVAGVVALLWWRRPAARRSWMRWAFVAAAPCGPVAAAAVRWALWLPFVVDGAGIRRALLDSADASRGRVVRTTRPLAGVLLGVAALTALLVAAPAVGVPATLVSLAAVVLVAGLLMALAVLSALLHEDVAPSVPPPAAAVLPVRARRLWRLARKPGLTVALLVGLLAQGGWSATRADAAVAVAAPDVVVTSLADALDTTGQCITAADACTVRAAIATAPSGGRITFAVSGVVELVEPLRVQQSLTLDGTGRRVTLHSPPLAGSSAVLLGAGLEGGGEQPPGEVGPAVFVLRGLTFLGRYDDGSAVTVSSGAATVDSSTFTRHRLTNGLGSALSVGSGSLSVVNSTFVDNSAFYDDGGSALPGGTVAGFDGTDVSVLNSTFVDNHGGGVRATTGSVVNSLFRGASGGFNCQVMAVDGNVSNDGSCATGSSRTNLTSTQLALGPLADGGGPVDTVPLRTGSAAIAAGTVASCPTTDARGEPRGGTCDAGAYQTSQSTTTTVTVPANPTRFGAPVTVTVAVENPQGTPTGSVQLAGTPAGTQTEPLVGGVATFSLAAPVGSHTLQATYVPDAALTASTGSLVLVVEPQVSATTLAVDPSGGSAPGVPVTLTATVRNGGNVLEAQPEGSVDFSTGSTALGSGMLTGGTATWTGSLPLGTNALSAVYVPSNGFLPSTGTATHSVQSVGSVAASAPASSVYGAPFPVGATVPSGATGSVVFAARSASAVVSLAPVTVSGDAVAATWTPVLAPGEWSLTAEYGGDATHAAAVSAPVTTTVQPAGTAVTLAGPSSSTVSGEAAAFTATVHAPRSPAVPTGSVRLDADGSPVATATLVAGVAVLATTDLLVGSGRVMTATYVPDAAGFTAATSAAVLHTVVRGSTTTGLVVPEASVSGEGVVLEATVVAPAPSTAAPVGSVTFAAGGTSLGTAPLSDGKATLTTTALPVGASAVTATFGGTSELTGSTSAVVQHSVGRATTTVSLTVDPSAPVPGQPVALTAAVAVVLPGSGVPSGSVVLRDGTTVLGTVPVSGGTGVLQLGGLSGGVHELTATYAGDTRLAGSQGSRTVTVGRVPAYVTIDDVSPEPSRFGSPVTVTVSVVGSTGLPVTGVVELVWGGSSVVGSAPVVRGVATISVSDLSIVRTTLSAHYLGDADHDEARTVTGSDEVLTWHRVLRAAPSVVLSSASSTTRYGDRIRLYADVAPVLGHVPTGLVRFAVSRGGPVPTSRFDASGRAYVDFSPSTTGQLAVSVTVDADPWFDELSGDGLTQEVAPGAATVALTAGATVVGEPARLVAQVGPTAAYGVGWVRVMDGDTEVGHAPVDDLGRAVVTTTFRTKGVHTLTALYDGAYGPFDQVRSAPLPLAVAGRPARFGQLLGGSEYGDQASLATYLTASVQGTGIPTGSVSVRLGERLLGSAVIDASRGDSVLVTPVPLGRRLEPGSYAVSVTYSGDAVFEGLTQAAVFEVSRRVLVAQLDEPRPPVVAAGTALTLTGRIVVPPLDGVLPPTGTLQLGRNGASCTVALSTGATAGSCATSFPGVLDEQLVAAYSGDSRYEAVRSPVVRLSVVRSLPRIEVSTSFGQAGSWTDAEPATVTWRTVPTTTAPLQGGVEVWTSEGRRTDCQQASAGSCEVRFATARAGSWVEVRYAGDEAYLPSTRHVDVRVRACHDVRVRAPGRLLTAANCAGTKFLSETPLAVEAPARAGHTFEGWAVDRTPGTYLEPGPFAAYRDLDLEPRYAPVCVTLSVQSYPAELPLYAPYPAPNCYEAVGPDFTVHDVEALVRRDLDSGLLRYRVGTRIELPVWRKTLTPTMSAYVRWRGEGVGADGVLTAARDVDLEQHLDLPCRSFTVDAPPGATAGVSRTSFDDGGQVLLSHNPGGLCRRGDGSYGYLTGTEVTVSMTPAAGTWFDRWGAVEPVVSHRAPTAVGAAGDRPADTSVVGRAVSTTVTVPDYDAAMSGFTREVTCYRLDVTVQDAVGASSLVDGAKPASVTTTAGNCPYWWTLQHAVPTAERGRWFVAGTDVDVTASGDARRGYVDGFVAPRAIEFRRWSGGVTGEALAQRVRMDRPVSATAQWYVPARCVPVIVRTNPVGSGEVLLSDLGTDCPPRASMFAGVAPVPQATLGRTISLAARPNGSLQTIWTVDGTSVSNTQACLTWNADIAARYDEAYERGLGKASVDELLMSQGYLPGYTVLRIQQEAARMQALGWTQANIVADLKTMGLLLASGAAAPDRLRTNPCDSTERSTVLPAGERGLSMAVDGSMVYTAWFCQAVNPSVTVVGLDGTSAPATGAQLDAFGRLFRSSNDAGNCPTPGWFLPGTTAVLGGQGTGVPGYVVQGWTLDGVAQSGSTLSVPISATGAARSVGVTVKVTCHRLTVKAEFGSTAYPLPNCPGADPSRGLYAEGAKVTVTAGQSSGHVMTGWHETSNPYNPTLAVMDAERTLTADFRAKTAGEVIMESVVDPALDAAGIAAKKAVGGIAYVIKVFGSEIIDGAILGSLSSLGTALQSGFSLIGVQGAVLDGIVLGLQTPDNAFDAAFAGFDCVQEWAWGTSLPTVGDLKDTVTGAVTGEAKAQVAGVDVDTVLAEAQLLAAKMEAGDPAVLAQAYITAAGGGPAVMVVHLALDISENPDVWQARATTAGEGAAAYALDLLAEEFGTGFTWESSATEAWTTGGSAFLSCMADNGRAVAGQ